MRSLLKSSVFGLTALFASAAMACPDLSGSYVCAGEALVVSQQVGGDKVTTYYLNGGQAVLRADGVSRSVITGDESVPMIEESYTCAGNKLVYSATGDVMHGGYKVGLLTSNTEIFIADGSGQLDIVTTGNIALNNGQVHPIQDSETCSRN